MDMDSTRYSRLGWKRNLTSCILGLLAVAGWITAVVFAVLWERSVHQPKPIPSLQVSSSWMGKFTHGAVAADNGVCSEIGRDILKEGGNAVDAAIAALICDGNKNPFSMGLGGGFFMVFYNKTSGKCHAIDARETAPNFVRSENFQSHPTVGWNSIAVPGELMGYWEIYKRFASLPWKKLLAPGIKLAKDGMFVSGPLAKVMRHPYIYRFLIKEPTMAEFFVDTETNDVFEEGAKIKNPKLAATLKQLSDSDNPAELFYGGPLGEKIVEEIQNNGGNVTLEDLKSYKVRVYDGWETNLSRLNLTYCSLGMPSGGPAAGLYLQLVDVLNISPDDMTNDVDSATVTYHKLIEAQKLVYGHWKYFGDSNDSSLLEAIRLMKSAKYAEKLAGKISKWKTFPTSRYDSAIGDSGKTGPLDKGGTAQISIIDQWGNAVSVTSSINWLFGSMRRSNSTGIIWNNHLADFSSDRESFNSMKPGKRPRSAMTPVIIIDRSNNAPQVILGGAGGSKITGTVGYVRL